MKQSRVPVLSSCRITSQCCSLTVIQRVLVLVQEAGTVVLHLPGIVQHYKVVLRPSWCTKVAAGQGRSGEEEGAISALGRSGEGEGAINECEAEIVRVLVLTIAK